MKGLDIILKKVLNKSKDSFAKEFGIKSIRLSNWETNRFALKQKTKDAKEDESDFVKQCQEILSKIVYKIYTDASYNQETKLATYGVLCTFNSDKVKDKVIFQDFGVLENYNSSFIAELESIKIGVQKIKTEIINTDHYSKIILMNDCESAIHSATYQKLDEGICTLTWINRENNLAHKLSYNCFKAAERKEQQIKQKQTKKETTNDIKFEMAGVNGFINKNGNVDFSIHGAPKDILKICNKIIEQILNETKDLEFN